MSWLRKMDSSCARRLFFLRYSWRGGSEAQSLGRSSENSKFCFHQGRINDGDGEEVFLHYCSLFFPRIATAGAIDSALTFHCALKCCFSRMITSCLTSVVSSHLWSPYTQSSFNERYHSASPQLL